MRQNIYQRAIDCFHGVTIGQIHELEAMGVLQKIARGWYWCRECGWEKPQDYKFEKVLKRRRIL